MEVSLASLNWNELPNSSEGCGFLSSSLTQGCRSSGPLLSLLNLDTGVEEGFSCLPASIMYHQGVNFAGMAKCNISSPGNRLLLVLCKHWALLQQSQHKSWADLQCLPIPLWLWLQSHLSYKDRKQNTFITWKMSWKPPDSCADETGHCGLLESSNIVRLAVPSPGVTNSLQHQLHFIPGGSKLKIILSYRLKICWAACPLWKTGAILRVLDVGSEAFEILRVKVQGTGIREGEYLAMGMQIGWM